MKAKQFIGPFSAGQSIDLGLSGVTYVQIGIEHPHSIPISEFTPTVILSINNTNYCITEKDILEFKMDNIPRLDQLINDFNKKQKNESFEKYLAFFKDFVDKLKEDKIPKDNKN